MRNACVGRGFRQHFAALLSLRQMLPHLLALLRLRAVLPLRRFDEFSAFAIVLVDGPPQLRDALVAEREDVDRLPMAECRLNLGWELLGAVETIVHLDVHTRNELQAPPLLRSLRCCLWQGPLRSPPCHLQLQCSKTEAHCVARTRGAIQPAGSRTMRSWAETGFDNMIANKIKFAIIINMQPVYLCRRTPFMISSLHVTKVMMLNMIMTTRRGCGSLCNLYASAVGHLS